MHDDPGNTYELTATESGIPTFRHRSTRELLHGQVGPWEEATKLYISPSKIEQLCQNSVVVYDVGLGCGTLPLATLSAFASNKSINELFIVSFDLETRGLEHLLSSREHFPFALPWQSAIASIVSHGEYCGCLPDGRRFRWLFVGGDFAKLIYNCKLQLPLANFVFFDFFSPASHPSLWTLAVFEWIYSHGTSDSLLITYSSATSVRAALAAAGFFVGLGTPSGKKEPSTMASRSLSQLNSPLPAEWLKRFERSHKQFSPCENETSQHTIRSRLATHAQFIPPSS